MKQIFLTGKNKHLFINVFDGDYEKYKHLKWRLHPRGYLLTTINDQSIVMKKEDGSNYRIKVEKCNKNKSSICDDFEKIKNCHGIYRVFKKYQVWVEDKSCMKFIGCYSKLESAIKVYNNVCEYYGMQPI